MSVMRWPIVACSVCGVKLGWEVGECQGHDRDQPGNGLDALSQLAPDHGVTCRELEAYAESSSEALRMHDAILRRHARDMVRKTYEIPRARIDWANWYRARAIDYSKEYACSLDVVFPRIVCVALALRRESTERFKIKTAAYVEPPVPAGMVLGHDPDNAARLTAQIMNRRLTEQPAQHYGS